MTWPGPSQSAVPDQAPDGAAPPLGAMAAAGEPRANIGGMSDNTPLAVDVDGTLIRGDLLTEGIVRLLATAPASLLALPWWLAGGRAGLKRKVAERATVAPGTLQLNSAVLAEVRAAKAAGREVWLASGADAKAIAPLAATLEADGHIASDGRVNLVGTAKAAALTTRFGERGFDYIGNARHDLPVWNCARRAIGVNLPPRRAAAVQALCDDVRLLSTDRGTGADHWRALRPHQWAKNILVFAPLLAAHNLTFTAWQLTFGLFVAFCACASAGYVLNDLADLPHDRSHANKRRRPLASGAVRPAPLAAIGVALAVGGVALAFWISLVAGLYALCYVGLAGAYSLWLKRRLFLDVIVLSGFYSLRVLAGAAAAAVPLSPWFLALLLFAFLALAILKRQTELKGIADAGRADVPGRGYVAEDLASLTALGAASGFTSVVVLALYIQSDKVADLYGRPEALWLTCPLLLYWFGRTMVLANRGRVHDDPILFALRDRASWITVAGIAAAVAAAL